MADERHRLITGETDQEWHRRVVSLTGRMIWLDDNDGPFGSKAAPETVWCANARPGEQSGTYFRSVRTHEGMTVWTRGGRDVETLAAMEVSRG